MPGYLLHATAQVQCQHGGSATPLSVNARILVSGQPTVTLPMAYAIAGCGGPSPPGPCVMGQWITAAIRVISHGQPLLLDDSQAVCAAPGTGLNVVMTQTRVRGA